MSESKVPKSGKSSSSDINKCGGSENVRVVVRCRPLSRKESDRNCKLIAHIDVESRRISVLNPGAPAEEPKSFTFDNLFPTNSTQADVYNEVARPIVENVLEGYNGTIFAYGQTGTGKTFTMEGVYNVPELKGIIPNSFAQIFSHISKAEGDTRFLVRCSYLEIYNEDVRDLLSKNSNAKLEVKESKDRGVYVKDLSSFVVRNADDMDKIMNLGNRNRSVASTNMNSVSSRSHAIFSITVECSQEHKYTPKEGGEGDEGQTEGQPSGDERSIRVGKLNLVDLAGSERLSKTHATGDRLKEATKINLSLSNLGNVISALVDGSSHVPYRNSKLTRLLQDSLGGNSKTVMVANVGPADYNHDETVSTLRFANRAKNIRNHAVINEDPKDALLRQFELEIQELRRQLEEELASATAASEALSAPDEEEGEEELGVGYQEVGDPSGGVAPGLPNEEALLGIKDELESHAKLSTTIGDESQDRRTVISALKERVLTWKQTEEQKQNLQQRLKSLQRKILVGGENLLDKSQAQEELLLRSMKEISLRKEEELQLKQHLAQQEEERVEVEGKILSCQEQNLIVSKKLKKVWNNYQSQKSELSQVQLEYREETDGLMDDVHRLSRELQYHNQLIDNFIPPTYQKVIEKNIKWQPDGAEWTLKCVAYAGNNMTRGGTSSSAPGPPPGHNQLVSVDLSSLYLDIGDECLFQDEDQQNRNDPGSVQRGQPRGGGANPSRDAPGGSRPGTSVHSNSKVSSTSTPKIKSSRARPPRSRMSDFS